MKLFVTAFLITTGFAFILGDTPDELERKRLLIQQYTKLYEDCLTESKCFDKPGLLCFAKCNDRAKDNLGIPRDPENNISEEDELNEFEESNDTTTDPNIDQEQNYETNDETVTDPNINQEQNYETIDETVTDPNISQEQYSETIVETVVPNDNQQT